MTTIVPKKIFAMLALAAFLATAVSRAQEAMSPDDWLVQANQQYAAGDIESAKTSALKVLDIGQKRSNPEWIGGALTVLCRTALAEGDLGPIQKFRNELQALIDATGDQQWSTVVAEVDAFLNSIVVP